MPCALVVSLKVIGPVTSDVRRVAIERIDEIAIGIAAQDYFPNSARITKDSAVVLGSPIRLFRTRFLLLVVAAFSISAQATDQQLDQKKAATFVALGCNVLTQPSKMNTVTSLRRATARQASTREKEFLNPSNASPL